MLLELVNYSVTNELVNLHSLVISNFDHLC